MSLEQIDSASVHSVISALLRRQKSDWTEWERRALAEVTLSLLFRANVSIPPPPKGSGRANIRSLVDHIFEILEDFVYDAKIPQLKRKEALDLTKSWLNSDLTLVRKAYKLFNHDPSAELFIRGAIERDWPYHVSRHGGLIDAPVFDEIAKVLQWSTKMKSEIRRLSKEERLIKLWSKNYKQSGELPPREYIDGYIVSALVRGRYYQHLAQDGINYIWHSFRNSVVEPVTELTNFDLYTGRLVQMYLAGMICCSAMEESSDDDIIKSWAKNIRYLRSKTLEIPLEAEPDRALSLAVDLARRCDLEIRWNRLERILEGALHQFILPVIGFAAGIFTLGCTGSHAYSLVAHVVAENCVRPYASSVENKINNTATGSAFYLRRLAEKGAKRVFAVTKDDLQKQKNERPFEKPS